MRLDDAVVGVGSGHVLMAHTSMIASMIASKAWLSLSLAIVSRVVIAMKTLWAPVVVAGGMMTISVIAWLSLGLSLVIISSIVPIVPIVTIVVVGAEAIAVGGWMIAMVSLGNKHRGVARLRLSLSLAIVSAIVSRVVITMKTLRTPVGVAVASVWMEGSSVAIARLGEGEGGQRENLQLIKSVSFSALNSEDNLLPGF